MNSRIFVRGLACSVSLWALQSLLVVSPPGMTCSASAAAAAEVKDEGAEVLTRGPVHEAFAETVIFKPTPGILAPKGPPAAVEELPPEMRPAGDNVAWIPGYWAWDDESNEFLWVSGIWRNLPPNRQWVPGYWRDVEPPNYQWISGYWADAGVEEVAYLPEPPASVEAGPNIEAPSENSIWVSGNWRYNDYRYRWSPGYWEDARPDWVWMPAHYVWSPHGYIFVDGYWDYSLDRRGVCFAPVRFVGDYYAQPGYYYRPSIVISLGVFTDHLFLRPRCRHYYFGDYYDPYYRNSGFYASYSYYSGGYGYDPIYAHQRWLHRNDNRWERRRAENFRYYRDNRDERPPRTLAAFERYAAGRRDGDRRVDPAFATPLSQFVSRKESKANFKAVDESERQKFAGRGREIRQFGQQRKELAKTVPEATVADATVAEGSKKAGADKGRIEPARVKLPKSPLVSRVTENAAKEDVPPVRPKAAVLSETTGQDPTDQPRGEKKGKQRETTRENPAVERRGKPDGEQPGKKSTPDTTTDTPKGEPGVERKGQNDRKTVVEEPKTRPKRGSGNDSTVEPKREPKREPRVEPKPEPRVEPKPQPRVEPKNEPKVEPKVEPRVEPKREPRIEPKREPRAEPKREPKREPKIEARREPRIEPRRIEPRREQPKVQPRQQPSQPRSQPKSQPKSQPEPRKERPGDTTEEKGKKKK